MIKAKGTARLALSRRLRGNQHTCCVLRGIKQNTAIDQTQPILGKPAHGQRINPMLLRQHPRGEARLIIVIEHRHRRLNDYRPVVKRRRHKMHRAPVNPHTFFKGLAMRVQTGK